MLISHFMDFDMQQRRSANEGLRFNKFQFYYYEIFSDEILGENRRFQFQDPTPPVTFLDEIYDATFERSGCFEFNALAEGITGSDDCLFLNVYTKNVKPKKLLPVMVYIHGGAFLTVNIVCTYQIFFNQKIPFFFRDRAQRKHTIPISC